MAAVANYKKLEREQKSRTIKIRITRNSGYNKPYIGGMKDLYSNKVFLHGFSQTNQKRLCRPKKFERETQTKKTITKACNAKREFGTQTKRNDLFVDDRKVTVSFFFLILYIIKCLF